MKPLSLDGLASIVGGQRFGEGSIEVRGFALDNRTVKPGDLFLAVRGANVDGHDFVASALERGAAASLVEKAVAGPHVLVSNLVDALAKIGSHFRATFDGPVVAVTGSAGKTTTKEFVAAALSPLGPVLKTEGNRNTEYTAPLLWAELLPEHKAVVVEMAMRGFGQISHLASFSMPTVGVITNIGHSHMDLVGSRDGIAQAKGELLDALPADGLAVLWQEDPYTPSLRSRFKGRSKTFGFGPEADCRITGYRPITWNSCVVEGKGWRAELTTVGRHIALNVAAAVLVAAELGVDIKEAAERIKDATLPPMRMEVRDLAGATVVLDAYNASPSSMAAAIETLAELPCTGRRLAVIGEMKELGPFSEEGHRLVGRALARHGIERAIFLGEETRFAADAAAGVEVEIANSLEDVTQFLEDLRPGDTVLLKGSRAMELEKALEPLMGAAR